MLTDNFDRKAMLEDWAYEYIVPAFRSYYLKVELLEFTTNEFINNPNSDNFTLLKMRYIEAYLGWQKVSMFDIGKAEEIGLRNYTNIYPTDTTAIKNNITSQDYNLELPSNFDTQGFPALDFLLYGIASTESEIIDILSTPPYQLYLGDLVTRLFDLTQEATYDWELTYAGSFINNDGSSGTASVDKLVNDFLFYYERYLRAGKIGLPAGVFSGNAIAQSVEAPYSGIYSKGLFLTAFEAVHHFFEGRSFDGLGKFMSLKDYLNHISMENNSDDIATKIIEQWTQVSLAAAELDNNLKDQVINDNMAMLSVYDELQKAVVVMKVDMMQALNIQIDYVDADGD